MCAQHWPYTNNPPTDYRFWQPDPLYQPNYQQQWWFSCPHCGSAISSIYWFNFCPFCGKPLNETPKTTLDDIKKILDEINKKFDTLQETKIGEKE